MMPLCITPVGLQSSTHESNPLDDPRKWKSAHIGDWTLDYYDAFVRKSGVFHQRTHAWSEGKNKWIR